jgi:arylsulfatase A-like enzyme
MFFSDDMNPDYMGFNGGPYPTPNLDRLAAEGMRLTHAYACAPMCTPSRYGLLTGQMASRCRHPQFLDDNPSHQPACVAWNTFLQENVATLPRLLSSRGYVTGMSGKWHLGPTELKQDRFMQQVSADARVNTPELNDLLQQHQARLQSLVCRQGGFHEARSVIWKNSDRFKVRGLAHHNFAWITQGAVDLLESFSRQDQPFFLYVASTALHGPHHADSLEPDPCNTQGGRVEEVMEYRAPVNAIKARLEGLPRYEQYKVAGLAELDHQVGVVLDTLERLGLVDDTLFIFMSDHGIEPAKATCYQLGVHVPAVVRWPGHVPPGSVSDALVQNIDILPTVLEAAGAPPFADVRVDGKSFLPVLRGREQQTRDVVFAEAGYSRSVFDGRYKYIAFRPPRTSIDAMRSGERDTAVNLVGEFKQAHSQIAMQYYPHYFAPDQLYDLETDPYEQINLVDDPGSAEMLNRLKHALSDHLATIPRDFDTGPVPFMESEAYRRLAARTRELGTDHIPWWQIRDIPWPPDGNEAVL